LIDYFKSYSSLGDDRFFCVTLYSTSTINCDVWSNFRCFSIFLDFFWHKAIFIMNVINGTKIAFSEKAISSVSVTIANAKAMDRLHSNAQCSLIRKTT